MSHTQVATPISVFASYSICTEYIFLITHFSVTSSASLFTGKVILNTWLWWITAHLFLLKRHPPTTCNPIWFLFSCLLKRYTVIHFTVRAIRFVPQLSTRLKCVTILTQNVRSFFADKITTAALVLPKSIVFYWSGICLWEPWGFCLLIIHHWSWIEALVMSPAVMSLEKLVTGRPPLTLALE